MLTVAMKSHQLVDEVGRYIWVLEKYTFDTLADVGARDVEAVMQHRVGRCKIRVWCIFETAKGRGRNHKGTHVVWRVSVGVDVLQAVGWSCHVLLGVVVTDEIHN